MCVIVYVTMVQTKQGLTHENIAPIAPLQVTKSAHLALDCPGHMQYSQLHKTQKLNPCDKCVMSAVCIPNTLLPTVF